MDVEFFATRAQADVLQSRERSENDYDSFPDQNIVFCFIDLVQSTNFRIIHGPKKGYVRSSTFFSLINSVRQPCVDIELVKEIGDEVLLSSPHFRVMFELVLLVDQVAAQIAAVAKEDRFPFGIRAAIGFGVVKRLGRPHLDFLGSPIDQLARVMSVRSESTNLMLHEDAYRQHKQVVEEYKEAVSVSPPKTLDVAKSKTLAKHVLYRELYVKREALRGFRQYFRPWSQARRSQSFLE
jgi:hypothetical protein